VNDWHFARFLDHRLSQPHLARYRFLADIAAQLESQWRINATWLFDGFLMPDPPDVHKLDGYPIGF
jgi:hypothetical protein